MVNFTLLYAKKDRADHSIHKSLHNEVKASLCDYNFINTDGSVLDNKAAAGPVVDNYSSIEQLPDESAYIFC